MFVATLLVGCAAPAPGRPDARGLDEPSIPMPIQARAVMASDGGPAEMPAWNLAQVEARPTGGHAPTVVAVLDTGADIDHPALAGRTYPVEDVVGDDAFRDGTRAVSFRGRDGNGHGTHVAGVVLAVGGGAPVRVLPVKVIPHGGVGDDRLLMLGIERALAWRDADDPGIRVRVLNLSVSSPEVSERLVRVIRKATDQGVLVVGASGNEGRAVEFPATMPEVLTVGATAAGGGWAPYSCFGDAVDVAAPGGSELMPVYSAWPTYLTATDLLGGKTRPHPTAGLVGTSMAAPHVSGAIAALWSQRPGLTASQVRGRMLAMAVDLGNPGPDARYGFGRLAIGPMLAVESHDGR